MQREFTKETMTWEEQPSACKAACTVRNRLRARVDKEISHVGKDGKRRWGAPMKKNVLRLSARRLNEAFLAPLVSALLALRTGEMVDHTDESLRSRCEAQLHARWDEAVKACRVTDKGLKRKLQKGGAIHTAPTWGKNKKAKKSYLPW